MVSEPSFSSWAGSLHSAISASFTEYSAGKSSWSTLNKLLDALVALTGSQYGFIGQASLNVAGVQVLQLEAVTNIAWSPAMDKVVVPRGLQFTCDHGGLHVEPFLTGKPLVENSPKTNPKSVGRPGAHPPLDSLLGLPIFNGGKCVGVVEIANRHGGYSSDMIEPLTGITDALGVLLQLFSHAPISPAVIDPELDFSSSELSSSVIQSVGDSILVTDAELTIKLVNNGGLRLFGFDSIEQVRGKRVTDLLTLPELLRMDWGKIVQADLEGRAAHIPTGGDGMAHDVHGREIPVASSINVFLFGRRRYLCFILRDLRTLRSYEEKMRFMAFLSHELRTPLQVIVAGLHELQLSVDSPDGGQMRLLVESSNMITRIVNSVLDLTRLESGKVTRSDTASSIRQVIDGIISMLRPFKRSGVELRAAYDSSVPDLVKIDRVKVEHVLINLTNNALRHTSEGYVELRVSDRLAVGGTRVMQVDVTDTGSGIRPEDLSKLFHLYQVLDAPSSMHSAGTGLGLVIAKTFAQILGGDIVATSTYGRGSTFSFSFQYSAMEAATPARPATTQAEKRSIPATPVHESLRGKKVLVVDDNPVLRTVLTRTLRRDGCITMEAEDGRQALRALATFHPDLVLLDLIMPSMDGFATAEAIRNDFRLRIPIIGLTESDLQRCISAGFNTCLMKPVSVQTLRDTLISLLEQSSVPLNSLQTTPQSNIQSAQALDEL